MLSLPLAFAAVPADSAYIMYNYMDGEPSPYEDFVNTSFNMEDGTSPDSCDGISGDCLNYTRVNSDWSRSVTDLAWDWNTDMTFGLWVKPSSVVGNWQTIWAIDIDAGGLHNANGEGLEFMITNGNLWRVNYWEGDGSCELTLDGPNQYYAGHWYFLAIEWNISNNRFHFWINGTRVGTDIDANCGEDIGGGAETFFASYSAGPAWLFDGAIDEVFILQGIGHDISAIWNNSNGYFPGNPGGLVGGNNTHTVEVNDLYDDGNLASVTVTLDGSTNTTDSNGIARFYNKADQKFNYNVSISGYYNSSGAVGANETSVMNLSMANYTFANVTAKLTNALVWPSYNFTVAGKTYNSTETVYLQSGLMNVTFVKNDWHNYTFTISVGSTPTTVVSNVSGAYNNTFAIYALNSSGDSVTNFTVNISSTSFPWFSESRSTTNGIVEFNLSRGYDYLFEVASLYYADANTTQTASAFNNSYAFVIPRPNINLTFYDERTDYPLIGVDVTVTFIGPTNVSYTTNDSNLYLENTLDGGTYVIRYSAVNYSNRDYFVTYVSGTNNSIRLYLIEQAESNILPISVVDIQGNEVEGAIVHWLRWFGNRSTYSVVEMVETSESGDSNLYFEEYDAWYQALIFTSDGVLRKTVEARRYLPSDVTNGVIFAIDVSEDAFESYIPAIGMMNTGGLTYNEGSQTFSYTYSDSSGILDEICLNIYTIIRRNKVMANQTCSEADSGTLVAGYPNITGIVRAQVVYDTTTENSIWLIESIDLEFVTSSLAVFGQYGPFLSGIFVASVALISGANPAIPIIFGAAGLLLTVAAFGLDFTSQTVLSIVIIGVGLIGLMAWRKTS